MCRNCNGLTCQSCIDYLSDLIKLNPQKVIFCSDCEQLLNLRDVEMITKKGIEMIRIRCPSNNINCFEEIEIGELKKHLESCKFFDGKYKCSSCSVVDWQQPIKEHIKICPEHLDECNFCKEYFHKKDLKEHQKTCFKKPKMCKLCFSSLDDDNIHLHPSKDICIINIMNEVKSQIESNNKFRFNLIFIFNLQ